MLKLTRMHCTFGYAVAEDLKHGIGRTNPYNTGLLQCIYQNKQCMPCL